MNWSEKSKEIADAILKKMENGISGTSFSREEILNGLREAAMQGMAHECDIAVMPLLDKINKKSE